jgi:FkbM family methyltransferase
MGFRFRDKARIFVFELLRAVPRMFGLRSVVNREFLKRFRWILAGVMVSSDQNRFRILDIDCLYVLVEDSETFMPYWFKPLRGEIVVDIGAHVGRYTISSGKLVGDQGRVIAFEPDEANYRALLSNMRLNNAQNIIPLKIAAWNNEEDLKLYHGITSGSHSAKDDQKSGYTWVKARPVGRVLRELGINQVNWIKVDVEGAECEALQGLEEILSSNPQMVVEVSANNVQRIKQFAHETDYHIIAISPRIGDKRYILLIRPQKA